MHQLLNNTSRQYNNSFTKTIPELERKIDILRGIAINKTQHILHATKRGNIQHAQKIQEEKNIIEEDIQSYQRAIHGILMQNTQSQKPANDARYIKPKSIFSKIISKVKSILGNTEKEHDTGPDTLTLLSKPNVLQSTDALKDIKKGKSFPFTGNIRFRNENNTGKVLENFYCICQYTRVLERRNQKGFPMIAIIFRDTVTGHILGRNAGYLDEKHFSETGEFLVESTTLNKTPICNGKRIFANYHSSRRAA